MVQDSKLKMEAGLGLISKIIALKSVGMTAPSGVAILQKVQYLESWGGLEAMLIIELLSLEKTYGRSLTAVFKDEKACCPVKE